MTHYHYLSDELGEPLMILGTSDPRDPAIEEYLKLIVASAHILSYNKGADNQGGDLPLAGQSGTEL